MNKLITFGDSFIAQNKYFKGIELISWLDIICKENNFDLDGYGCPETGILNTIMNFKRYDRDFDVCIFAWTDPSREYLPTRTLKVIRSGDWEYITDKEKKIGDKYLKYFSDNSIRWLLSEAVLGNFDKELCELYPDKKFIHLYCFEISDKFYPHIFKHGINIKPELIKFSKLSDFKIVNDDRPLHMASEVHKSFAKQLNKVLKDESLNNGDIVEFNLEH